MSKEVGGSWSEIIYIFTPSLSDRLPPGWARDAAVPRARRGGGHPWFRPE